MMDAGEFRDLGTRMWGHGYQARVSRGLSVAERTVRRWASGKSRISAETAAKITALAKRAAAARAYAAERVPQWAAEAEAAGLDPAEAMAAIAERAALYAEISACASRRKPRPTVASAE